MKMEAKAFSGAMVTELQNKVYDAANDLKIRKARGDKDIIDTYEFGFLKAMAEIEKVYKLGIQGLIV